MRNADVPADNPLRRYFSGLADHVFHAKLGVADAELVDYVGELLLRFTRCETLQKVRTIQGRPIQEVAALVAKAEHRIGPARREVHRHVGDVALFWTGLYPETLRRMQGPESKDAFVDYAGQGKRSYLIAASITTPDDDSSGAVLERLGRNFELCAYGLGEIRREWDRGDTDDASKPLLWK